MKTVKEDAGAILKLFDAFEKECNGTRKSWVHELRRKARARAAELGIPTTKDEEWRYTNIAPLAKRAFSRPEPEKDIAGKDIAALLPPGLAEARLVFIDGRYSEALSNLGTLPKGVTLTSLHAALAADDKALKDHLAKYARQNDHPFVALNTAFLVDGAWLHVPKGVEVETPVHVLHIASGVEGQIAHPRNLFVLEAAARGTVLEHYAALSSGAYVTNAVTEVALGEGAVLDHTKLQEEGAGATHIASIEARLAGKANFANHNVTLGGELTRNDINAVLDGEQVECTVNGFYIANGTQHVDNHTLVDHAKPHCHSYEIYKGVMDDSSNAVFNGKIFVHQDAQKTDAKQDNKHLLLSRDAEVQTKPQLQIYADDVKCTHGATVGQLDPDAVFYLRSRGIGHAEARRLLTFAFAEDVLKEIKHKAVRAWIAGRVHERMAQTTGLKTR